MTVSQAKLSLPQLTLVVIGNVLGPGLFLLPANLAALGSISLIGWLFTALFALVMALLFARLGMIRPDRCSLYALSCDGIGRLAGFQVVYGYWFGIWASNVAGAVATVGYLSWFFPSLSNPVTACVTAIGIIWLLTMVNMTNLRFIGLFQSMTTGLTLIPVSCLALFGWWKFDPELVQQAYNVTEDSDLRAIISAASLTLWTFLGMEAACNAASAAKNPKRDVPLATLIGTVITAVIYLACTTVVMGLVPNDVLQSSSAPMALAVEALLGTTAGTIVSLIAVIACLGSLNSWILTQGLIARTAARDGLFPAFFARLNKNNVPAQGHMLTALLVSLFLIVTVEPQLNEQFEKAALVCVFVSLISYVYALSGSFVVLRQLHMSEERYRIMALIISISIFYCFMAAIGTGADVLCYGVLAVLFSVVLFACSGAGNGGGNWMLSDK
ncbi:amino acid permease [Endozoicomonadaceae bacterium StTr2]